MGEIEEITERYNKYHGTEARAELIEKSNGNPKIKFSGSFCETCGIRDYFDDFIIEAEKDIKLKIRGVKKTNGDYVVTFIIENGE